VSYRDGDIRPSCCAEPHGELVVPAPSSDSLSWRQIVGYVRLCVRATMSAMPQALGGVAMATDGANQVVGVFRSQRQANAAAGALLDLGFTEADVETGAPEPGRYGMEYDEGMELGRGVTFGIAVGVPVGAIATTGLLLILVPSLSVMSSIGLGVLIGGFWGIFFGGLGGMVPKVLAQSAGRPTYTATTHGADVVVIVHTAERHAAAHRVLARCGARYFLTDVPAIRQSDLVLSAAR
jgi:hypothetical protein